jgi:replicative DNA helicase
MNLVSIVNKLLSQRLSIPFDYFYKKDKSDEDYSEYVASEIKIEEQNIKESPYFRYIDKQSLSLHDIDSLIKQAMESMKQKYAVVTIDLLTMIKDFSGENKASKYEDAMNKLHEIAKKNNVAILGVVQTKRLSDKTVVKGIDDLEKFRPSIEEIKNAGAIEERSRIVLSLFRKKHEANKHFEKDDPILEIIEDIAEIEVLKQNLGEVGNRVKYLYEGEYSKFTPYIEE